MVVKINNDNITIGNRSGGHFYNRTVYKNDFHPEFKSDEIMLRDRYCHKYYVGPWTMLNKMRTF